jgi:hypothetical protein
MSHRFSRSASAAGVVAALLLLSACNSGPAANSSESSGALSAAENEPVLLAAVPVDVPSAAPSCGGSDSVSVPVPPSLNGVVSACASRSGNQMVVTNLSQFVLDVAGADGTSPNLTVTLPSTSSEFMPAPEDVLEVKEQNAALTIWQPPAGAVFLPVGGQVTATSSNGVQLEVSADGEVSATVRAAELLTGYVADSLPEDSVLSYYASIADCVNDAYSLWNDLNSQSTSASTVLQQALETISSCELLRQKLSKDVATEHADDGSPPDLATVAEHAGEDDWQEESHDVDSIDTDIR